LFTCCRAIESAPDTASPCRSFRVPCKQQQKTVTCQQTRSLWPNEVSFNLYSLTFLLLPTWYTNSMLLTQMTIKILYMFRAHSARQQEVHDANCTYAACGIVTVCKWLPCATAEEGPSSAVTQDSHLQTVTIPEAAYVQFASWTSWWWAECARNMYRILINVIFVNKQEVCVSRW
jgi:hypothetical protein